MVTGQGKVRQGHPMKLVAVAGVKPAWEDNLRGDPEHGRDGASRREPRLGEPSLKISQRLMTDESMGAGFTGREQLGLVRKLQPGQERALPELSQPVRISIAHTLVRHAPL